MPLPEEPLISRFTSSAFFMCGRWLFHLWEMGHLVQDVHLWSPMAGSACLIAVPRGKVMSQSCTLDPAFWMGDVPERMPQGSAQ
jgi:hypothetical protein